jgi:uncharacterized membrane protein
MPAARGPEPSRADAGDGPRILDTVPGHAGRRWPRAPEERMSDQRTYESPTVRNFRKTRAARAQGVADAITRFSGSMAFVVIHVVWFAAWILVNVAFTHTFDPFPFGLLTLIVSLEAIFLSTFVLISQNQQSAKTDSRAFEDFQTNLYAEVLVEMIGEHLGLEKDEVRDRFRAKLKAATDGTPDTTASTEQRLAE